MFIISGAFYSVIVSGRCSGGGSVSFRGMFVPSNTDLWDRLDALFLNELWIIGMRDDFLLRAVKYYMVRTFNLITGQNVSSHPRHFSPIHWNNQYQVFYLWPFIPNTVGTFLPERRVCLKLIWKNCKMHTESLMYCMWNWNISEIICIFKWYISLHFILKFSKYTFKCFLSEHLYTEDCSTRTKHAHRRWKLSPSYRSCRHISKKPHYWVLF